MLHTTTDVTLKGQNLAAPQIRVHFRARVPSNDCRAVVYMIFGEQISYYVYVTSSFVILRANWLIRQVYDRLQVRRTYQRLSSLHTTRT